MGDAMHDVSLEALLRKTRADALREAALVAADYMAMHNGKDMNSFRACLAVRDAILAKLDGKP